MCIETKRIIKSWNVLIFEGMKEIEGVRDNRSPSKQVEHVVDEAVNEDELVMYDNPISLKEKPAEDVEGESASNSYLDKEFVPLQDEGLNDPQ